MHGTMQARLAASAKLSLTVASKTVPPPIAALGSKVQRCLGKQGAGFLGFINCRRDFMFGQASSKYIRHIYQDLWGHCCLRPLNVESRNAFPFLLKLMFLISHPKLFLKIIAPQLSSHVFFKSCLTTPDNIEGARFFQNLFLRHLAPYSCLKL